MYIKDFDPYDFSKKEIDGVPVYYKNLPWAPCINIRAVFNSGAFDDPIGKEGVAHFLEHLPGNGSPLIPDKKAMLEWSKVNTLNSKNAWTDFDNTNYYLKCLPEKYIEVLRGMKDYIFFPYLRPEDVEHERKIVTQEAWGRFTNEKFLAFTKESLNNLFDGHTRKRYYNAVGWPETIAKISREDIVAWHKAHYGIGNFFIVLTGAVEESHVDAIKEFLKDLPKVSVAKRDDGSVSKPKQKRTVKYADEIGEIKEQVEISIERAGERLPYGKEEVRNLSARLLQDLLHEKLRIENSLCYGVSVGSWNEKTFFYGAVSVKTEEKNIDLVEREFYSVLNNIKEGKSQDRFQMIKKVYLEQVKSQEMLSSGIADGAVSEISDFDGHIVTQKEQLEKIEKVTYDEVSEFIAWAYDPEYVHTEIILPSKKDEK